jgi:hypothetical protein
MDEEKVLASVLKVALWMGQSENCADLPLAEGFWLQHFIALR